MESMLTAELEIEPAMPVVRTDRISAAAPATAGALKDVPETML